jgi:hypothetical protein
MVRSSVMKRCGVILSRGFRRRGWLRSRGCGGRSIRFGARRRWRGEVHAEVGHALVPGAGDAHLLGAVFGGVAGRWGAAFRWRRWLRRTRAAMAVFSPGATRLLIQTWCDAMVLPVGEEADAVAAGHDGFEIVLELVDGEVLVDDLGHLEAWADVERDLVTTPRAPRPTTAPRKMVAVFFAGEW